MMLLGWISISSGLFGVFLVLLFTVEVKWKWLLLVISYVRQRHRNHLLLLLDQIST